MLKIGGTFLDLPNTQQINYEDVIYEEYFVEKHKTHFMSKDILDIFELSGFQIDYIQSDPFNITMVAKKNRSTVELLENLKRSENYINDQIQNIKNYFSKFKNNKTNMIEICKNLNKFKFNQDVVFLAEAGF